VSSRRSATLSWGRVAGSSPGGQQLLPEDFRRRSEAEAYARRGVELVANAPQVEVVDRQGIEVSRQPFAGAAVGVFNRAFLPGRLWVAEPGLHAEPGLEIRPVGEFGAAVKGDRTARGMGKGAQGIDQPVHDRLRLPVVVAQQDREAADPFDQ